MKCDKKMMRLYAVTDRSWLGDRELYQQVEEALEGGATCIQIREKDMPKEDFLAEAIKIRELCNKFNVPLIINDDVEIAIECGADGVHVGQSDMSADNVRKIIGDKMILGVSAQTVEQAIAAEKAGADYLGVGAVFQTSTKTDADFVSYDDLKKICAKTSIPVVAIGGISEDNMIKLKGSGIDGVALVSAIFASDDIKKSCETLLNLSEQMVKTKIKGAIFDLDGTLLDSMYIWDKAGEYFLNSQNIVPQENLSQKLKTLNLYDAASYLKNKYNILDDEKTIVAKVIKLVGDFYINDAKIKDGVAEFLHNLKENGVKMCIATATDRRLAEVALKRNNIYEYFDRIFTCTEEKTDKENPKIFEIAREYLGFTKEDIMVFEDASHAVDTAKNAGFRVCGVYDASEENMDVMIQNSDIYIKSFKEAGDYID